MDVELHSPEFSECYDRETASLRERPGHVSLSSVAAVRLILNL